MDNELRNSFLEAEDNNNDNIEEFIQHWWKSVEKSVKCIEERKSKGTNYISKHSSTFTYLR